MTKPIYTEKQLLQQLLATDNSRELEQLKNKLLTHYESNYRNEITRIIASKYVLQNEDKSEAAKDLYSHALEIFLKKTQEGKTIFQELNYKAYMLGVARNLFLEKTRKNKEIAVDNVPDYKALDDELMTQNPFESEAIQEKVETALSNYYVENNLRDCAIIMLYGWKKEYKNHQLAELLNIPNPETKDASRRVSVIQQSCIKSAWRNIALLGEIKTSYHIKRRKRHEWQKQ